MTDAVLLERWMSMAAPLLVNGADERVVSALLSQEIKRDLYGLDA